MCTTVGAGWAMLGAVVFVSAEEAQSMSGDQFLSLPAVCKRYQVSRTTIWRWIQQGCFPEPVHLSPQTRRWCLSDLHEYEQNLSA